jgi:hypothetical protein
MDGDLVELKLLIKGTIRFGSADATPDGSNEADISALLSILIAPETRHTYM